MKKINSLSTFFVCFLFLLILYASSFATTLSTDLTADNEFWLYISIDDSQLGTYIDRGFQADYAYSFSNISLTPDVTNYIHLLASDSGVIAGFIGDFTLSDTDFHFTNDTQYLLTDLTNWQVYTDEFGGTSGTLTDSDRWIVWGWPSPNVIDHSAIGIWTDNGYDLYCYRYFSTSIIPTQPTGQVPEPSTMLLLGIGISGTLIYIRKKIL